MDTDMGAGMRRIVGRLTDRQARNAKPKKGRRASLLADGGNLLLQCSTRKDGSIARSWLFRYELDGERHDMGLGPLDTIGLARARERARSLREMLKEGQDPLDAKREEKRARLAKKAEAAKAITFRQCAEMYLRAHGDTWKNAKHRAQWGSTLETYAFPVLGGLIVSDIEVSHVIRAVEPIWKKIPETASRVRMRIEAVLDYATVRGFRSGDNPARWRGHLAEVFPARSKVRKVEHHPALPYAQLPQFMAELRGRDSTSARALEFTILCAVRTGETIGARWSEIDFEAKTWTIPPGRMKASRIHKVPLSARCVALLKALPHRGAYIFARADHRPLSNMAMLELLRGLRPGCTTHGFRSTFRDWAAERTAYPNHVVEMALAHKIADAVEAAYRRGDLFQKRVRLMTEWARYAESTPASAAAPATAAVTTLRVGTHA
jgi:integrase